MKNFIQIPIILFAALICSQCNLEKIEENLVDPGPTARFIVDKTGGEIPCTVTITNQSQNAVSYAWNFGNATTSTQQQPAAVTYNTAGDFTITLIATDAAGLKDTFSVDIAVTAPTIKFEKSLPAYGPGSKARKLADGGYILVGTINNDAYLVRTDANGNTVNERIYTDGNADVAQDVVQLSDGTFVVVGTTFNNATSNNDIYYLRVNSSLNILTGPIRLGTPDGHDEALRVLELADGSVLMVGYNTSVSTGNTDVYAARYSPDLSTLYFKKNFPAANAEAAFDAVQVSGGIVVTGEISYPGTSTNSNALFLKIDESGSVLTAIKSIGDSGFEQARSVAVSAANELIICGTAVPTGASNAQIYLQKISLTGDPIGSAILLGGSQEETGYAITSLTDGGFAIAGQTGLDAYLLIVDDNGAVQIDKPFIVNGEEAFYSIEQTADKGFILGGYKGSSLYFVKTDKNGISN